jgi:hypothetical protein
MPKNFSDGDFLSSTVLNNATVHKMTGAEIFALTTADTIPGYLVYCTATGNGFTLDNLYKMNETNTTWEVVGLETHTHTSTSGGGLYDVLRANMHTTYSYDNLCPTADIFYQATGTGGGGTITHSEINGVEINSSATSGGYATVTLAGVNMTFSQASATQVKLRATSATNFTQTRIGIGAEHANEANTTVRKQLFEGCSSSGVNWLVASSDGTTRSTLSTSSAVATGGRDGYLIENTIANITFEVNGTLSATKTTNVPTTGDTASILFRCGVKNTAAENKQLYLAGLRIAGTVGDPDWVA